MKKIMFLIFLFLSLMVCTTSLGRAGGFEDAEAGFEAQKRGDYDKAIVLFTKAIESGELSVKQLAIIYGGRGNVWCDKGDYDKAISDYTKAIEINPKNALAYNNRGYAWHDKGDYDKAIADYTKAIEINPKNALAYNNRGNAWYDKGDYDKAISDYTKAIEINPQYANAYYNRGYVWGDKGKYDKAISDYTKVIEINPKHVSAYNGLAWLMATCPDDRYRDGKQAVVLAEKAVKLDETTSRLDTLAAAYAEAGRFQDAIKTQERAITRLKQEGGAEDLPEYEEHLASYKAGKPWREK